MARRPPPTSPPPGAVPAHAAGWLVLGALGPCACGPASRLCGLSGVWVPAAAAASRCQANHTCLPGAMLCWFRCNRTRPPWRLPAAATPCWRRCWTRRRRRRGAPCPCSASPPPPASRCWRSGGRRRACRLSPRRTRSWTSCACCSSTRPPRSSWRPAAAPPRWRPWPWRGSPPPPRRPPPRAWAPRSPAPPLVAAQTTGPARAVSAGGRGPFRRAGWAGCPPLSVASASSAGAPSCCWLRPPPPCRRPRLAARGQRQRPVQRPVLWRARQLHAARLCAAGARARRKRQRWSRGGGGRRRPCRRQGFRHFPAARARVQRLRALLWTVGGCAAGRPCTAVSCRAALRSGRGLHPAGVRRVCRQYASRCVPRLLPAAGCRVDDTAILALLAHLPRQQAAGAGGAAPLAGQGQGRGHQRQGQADGCSVPLPGWHACCSAGARTWMCAAVRGTVAASY